MGYTGLSEELAYRKFQKDALKHIGVLSYEGGGHGGWLTPWRGNWEYLGKHNDFKDNDQDGDRWNGKGLRESVVFGPLQYIKADIHSGDPVPIGKLEPHYAIIGTAENLTPEDAKRIVSYQRGETTNMESQKSMTHGWHVKAWVEGQAGGGESSGGSYVKAGVEVGVHGEYASAMREGSGNSDLFTDTVELIIPAQSERDIEQLIQRGKVKVTFVHKAIINLEFLCVAYKKLRHHSGWINDNDDWGNWNGKSRRLWRADSLPDLFAILTGQHGDYRKNRKNWISANSKVRKAYEWLADEKNRTLQYKTEVVFDKSIKSHVRLTVG